MPDVGTAVEDSRALVALWFPEARAAWLGGSVILGQDTPGSDLDVTVLLAGPPAPFRDSRRYRGWPVELFVHTETSLDFYVRRDARSGRPTMPRLVGRSEVLVDTDGSGRQWQATARALLSAGPPRLAGDDLASLRYAVTDAMDDVTHAHDAHERLVTATMLADEAARLLLHGAGHWWGRGKWVVRELADLDTRDGSDWRARHEQGLVTAAGGDVSLLLAFADDVLALHGGPLFEGHRLAGTDPATDADEVSGQRARSQSGKSPSATRAAGPASSTR
ncbi:nucleotidyltransferase domain-containing protein [Terrabacter sp. MAHUQ-38]|uniref:nucleotidyltransferase domain-containing protein n=1 Tax=unclassified Terrabacter TaxID=2630222 RepID=UPI00165D836D|nr:nucleotidyltransferase domain-containing protein [Terrabacter sp. MAHUQ-38]MBC9821345.1 nucleotidyltransferase domain-containing protein [Terrabacter sp. MAHUQ-38]